jgi:AWS domain
MPEYKKLRSNLWHSSALSLRTVDKAEACNCASVNGGGRACGDSTCLNRAARTECDPGRCPCGTECRNQRMQRNCCATTMCAARFSRKRGIVLLACLVATRLVKAGTSTTYSYVECNPDLVCLNLEYTACQRRCAGRAFKCTPSSRR